MFAFDAFPTVQAQEAFAVAVLTKYNHISLLDRITPDVSGIGCADSRARMAALVSAKPTVGSIKVVWAASDQPALGA